MQQSQTQHPNRRIVDVADETLIFRQVTVDDSTPIGAQLAAAAGFKPDQLPVVLLLLSNGAMEDIRPDEKVNLSPEIRRFIIVESDRKFFFTVDGARLEWPCSLISGHVVRTLGEVGTEKKLLLECEDEADREIQNDEIVSLDGQGIERFISRKASWTLNVQGKEYTFDTPTVIVRDAVVRAGLNPNQAWHIFFKIEGEPKIELGIDDVIDLRKPGIEKLRLTPRDVGNGEGPLPPRRLFSLLPGDEQYLDDQGYRWETCLNNEIRWLVIHEYALPTGYNHQKVKLALLVPTGYPMNMLDMLYVYPSLTLADGASISATQVTGEVDGDVFQGWSRHRPWNPATDTVISQLAMADGCLLKEVGQ